MKPRFTFNQLPGILLGFAVAASTAPAADNLSWLDAYNVVWTAPSKHSGESMPVGGGDIGLNVWVEDGDVLFYVGQSGCVDENGALLKHGRVRISLEPNPFAPGSPEFRQELKLRESCVEITGQSDGASRTTVRVWVEVQRPVIHVDVAAAQPISACATFETWRYQDILLDQGSNKHQQAGMAMMNRDGFPGKVWLYRDTIEDSPSAVTWFHRMRNDEGVFEYSVRQQGLEAVRDQLYDPLTDLTFGGTMVGEGFQLDGTTEGSYAKSPFKGWRYKSQAPAAEHHVGLYCHIEQTKTVEAWKERLQTLANAENPSRDEAWQANGAWWDAFWNRSHIVINAEKADPTDKAWQVGRNYNLFRYQLACNLSGRQPTLFNGGLFTYDPMHVPYGSGPGWTPDWRRWGAGLTAQNQRLLYWPLLAAGDFDVIVPGLDFYRLGLASSAARVKHYWGHEGCCCAEQISVLGLPGCAMWGFVEGGRRARPANYEHGVQVNGATHYLYQAQLEFAYMMLKWYCYSGRDIRPYLPFIDAAVRFYDRHYRMRKKQRDGRELDENGHIVISPSMACESYGNAINPADATAGLHAVLDGLLALDDTLVSPQEKAEYRAMLTRVPPIPIADDEGHRVLAPTANFKSQRVKEIPELYPVFPYDRYGLGREGCEMARETWHRTRGSKASISWHQGGIFCARLGLADEAAEFAIKKLADSGRRFPTFWGPGHDWVPDHNWGGSGMIGLQEMLMQTAGHRILLLPAWPKAWDCEFKLLAPYQTVVEGKVLGGRLVDLKVTPQNRRKDVEIVAASDRPGKTATFALMTALLLAPPAAGAAQPPINPLGEMGASETNSIVNMSLCPQGKWEVMEDSWGKIVRVNMLKITDADWAQVPGVKKAWRMQGFEGEPGMAFHPIISEVKDVDGDGKPDIFRLRSEHAGAQIERLRYDDGSVVWESGPVGKLAGDESRLAVFELNGPKDWCVFYADKNGAYCFDAATGKTRWQQTGGGIFTVGHFLNKDKSAMAIRGGGTIYCLDETGAKVWQYDCVGLKKGGADGHEMMRGDFDGDGLDEIVVNMNNVTLALRGDGRLLWEDRTQVWHSDYLDLVDVDGDGRKDLVYDHWGCSAGKGPALVVDALTGQKKLEINYRMQRIGHPQNAAIGRFDPSISPAQIAICDKRSTIVLWDLATGKFLWKRDAPASLLSRGDWDGDGNDEVMAFSLGANVDGMFSVWNGKGERLYAISFLPSPSGRTWSDKHNGGSWSHAMPGGHEGIRRQLDLDGNGRADVIMPFGAWHWGSDAILFLMETPASMR